MRYDSAHLQEEYRHAREVLARRSLGFTHIVEAMAGGLTLDQHGEARRLIENHYHEFRSYVGPRICSNDPKVRVTTPRAGVARTTAAASEVAVNQWIKDTHHREFLQRLCSPYLFGWGVAGLRLERIPGVSEDDDYATTPAAFEIDAGDAFWDVAANAWETKQFAGFCWSTDKYELQQRARKQEGWIQSAIEEAPVDYEGDDGKKRNDKQTPKRGEVVIREMWCPRVIDENAPSWATGTVFTFAAGTQGFIREPRPFFGPPWGPIYLFDAYHIPGQSLGAGPCEFDRELVDELNRHANAMSASTAARRRIGIGGMTSKKDIETINATPEGHVALLEMFDGSKYIQTELGGATAEQRMAILDIRQRLKLGSGLGDAQKGATTGVGTATENAIAAEASGTRLAGLAQRFADCDAQLLRGVLWFIMHTRSMKVRVNAQDLGAPDEADIEVTIRGGPTEGTSWDDYRLDLDRYTMERVSEQTMQARAVNLLGVVMPIVQAAPQIAPYTDVRMILKKVGEAFNVPDLESLIDPDAAAALFGVESLATEGEGPEVELPEQPAANARPKINTQAGGDKPKPAAKPAKPVGATA